MCPAIANQESELLKSLQLVPPAVYKWNDTALLRRTAFGPDNGINYAIFHLIAAPTRKSSFIIRETTIAVRLVNKMDAIINNI